MARLAAAVILTLVILVALRYFSDPLIRGTLTPAIYTDEPNRKMRELLETSEDLADIEAEWNRKR